MAALYNSISDLPGGPRIRLLTLLPSDNFESEVCGQLTTVVLDECPKYEALSYVWGDATVKCPIQCNGVSLSITRNLLLALKHLRLKDEARVLWADAISINQEDLSERESQVSIMGRIYALAEKTVIWLGPATSRTQAAVSLCQSLALRAVAAGGENLGSSDAVEAWEHNRLILMDLVERPWWTRVWVVQELCLSRDVEVVIGPMNLPLATLDSAIKFFFGILFMNRSLTRNPLLLLLLSRVTMLLGRRDLRSLLSMLHMRKTFRAPEYNDSLMTNLVRFRSLDATDPRDKVYALLGLVQQADSIVSVNYRASTAQCYQQTAFAILQSSRNLDLFNLPSIAGSIGNTSLPSWVSDWNAPENSGSEKTYSMADRSVFPLPGSEDKAPKFKAGHHAEIVTLKLNERDALCLTGMITDSIVVIEGELRMPQSTDGMDMTLSEASSPAGFRKQLRTTWDKDNLHRETVALTTLYDWSQLVQSLKTYPTGEDPWQAFYATVTCGQLKPNFHDLPDSPAVFKKAWKQTYAGFRVFRAIASPIRSRFPNLSELLIRMPCSISGMLRPRTAKMWGEYMSGGLYQRLAKSQKGYLALVPSLTQVGDRIALLPGGKTPYVVRESGSQWMLIGEAYVHGIMFGEAWREEECHEMEFI